jgi:hypothetical protein
MENEWRGGSQEKRKRNERDRDGSMMMVASWGNKGRWRRRRVDVPRGGEPLARAYYGFAVRAVPRGLVGGGTWRGEEPEKMNAVQDAICAANACVYDSSQRLLEPMYAANSDLD